MIIDRTLLTESRSAISKVPIASMTGHAMLIRTENPMKLIIE